MTTVVVLFANLIYGLYDYNEAPSCASPATAQNTNVTLTLICDNSNGNKNVIAYRNYTFSDLHDDVLRSRLLYLQMLVQFYSRAAAFHHIALITQIKWRWPIIAHLTGILARIEYIQSGLGENVKGL